MAEAKKSKSASSVAADSTTKAPAAPNSSPTQPSMAVGKFNFANLNSLAVVAFALSVGWVGAVAGVITGHFALAKIKATGERGRRLAIASLIIGYGYIALSLLWAMFMAGLAFKGIVNYKLGISPFGYGDHMGWMGQNGYGQIQGMGGMMYDGYGHNGMGHMGFIQVDPNGMMDLRGDDLGRGGIVTPEPAPTN